MLTVEAINRIKLIVAVANGEVGLSKLDREALNMAIYAFEKQIPQKPLDLQETIDAAYVKYSCPHCSNRKCKVKGEEKYCVNCGQRIDWSGTET